MRKILVSRNIHKTQMPKTQVTKADQEQHHAYSLKVGVKSFVQLLSGMP